MTLDLVAQNQYLYDGDGRICAVASIDNSGYTVMTGYIYNAGGTRVAKGTITAWSCDPTLSGFSTTNDYILGLSGEQVTEMGMGGATTGSITSGLVWKHTNVWAAGKLLATYDGGTVNGTVTSPGLHFYFDDPLGTRRVQTDYAGNIENSCSSLPFGDGESCAATPTEHLFTGKERDTESGNDYFGARYYASSMGRFMSPDWAAQEEPVPYANLDDPQSLNLYAYVENNPLAGIDSDGHSGPCPIAVGPGGCDYSSLPIPGHDSGALEQEWRRSADGRAIPGDLGLSWIAFGKVADFLGGLLDNLVGRLAAKGSVEILSKLSPAERAVFDDLIASGHNVTQIARGTGKTADFLVDGIPTELKTLQSAGPNTLKTAIEAATRQTKHNIIIDARKVNIAANEVRSQILRAQGNVGNLTGRVTVLTKDGTVKF